MSKIVVSGPFRREMRSLEESRGLRLVTSTLIVSPDGLVLAQERADDSWAGFWEFAGGKVEPDESAAVAAMREVYEELGVVLPKKPEYLMSALSFSRDGSPFVVQFYGFAFPPNVMPKPKVDSRAVRRLQWVDEEAASQLRWLPATARCWAELWDEVERIRVMP